MGEPNRRHLLELLHQRSESTVSELVDASGLRQPQVSKHLKVLAGAALVSARVDGRNRRYRLDGRFVVVNNRGTGRVTMVAADVEDCVDKNNNGMIDTSTGKNDVLAFDNDECIAWHNPFSDFTRGLTAVRGWYTCDVALRYPGAFTYSSSIT